MLKWLLDHGADPNIHSVRRGSCVPKYTPLARAATLSDTGPLRILLSCERMRMDPEAIFFAIGFGRQFNGTATLKVLIEHGADVNYVSKNWYTPLFHAAWRGYEEKVRVLLENGADPMKDSDHAGRKSAMDVAKEKGYENLYEMMQMSVMGAP